MSVVGVMNKGGPEGSGYVHGITNLPLIDSPEICGGDRWFSVKEKLVEKEKIDCNKKRPVVMSSSSSSESSIGKNSDVTGEIKEESGETEEVQSPFKGPLDGMEALEEVLPMRRGISRFYNGKSKSFASLGEASSMSSIKHITKPENAYNKRRRNLLASALIWDNNNNKNNNNYRSSPLSCINGGGISKKIACNSSNRASTLAFALSMSNNNNSSSSSSNHDEIGCGVNKGILTRFSSSSSTSARGFKNLSGWRSFSFADLQHPGSKIDAANPNPNPDPNPNPSS